MFRAALIWSDALAGYGFQPGHPLDPKRLALTVSLIRELGLVDGPDRLQPDRPVIEPRPASDADLRRVHAADYIAAVERLSAPGARQADGARWGLGDMDTPVVEGMHVMAAHVAGATLAAAAQVMEGHARRAFSPAGGLHHAHRDRASGFCVYNDLAVAIAWMRERYGARVLYIDYDAHHGDGVQSIFYDDPEVLTLSFHESGRYLFPGTGAVSEMGAGDGYGRAVNVPLEPGTGDASWLAAFDAVVPVVAEAFRPDVVVLQNGCDGHALDPLAHLYATTGLFETFVMRVGEVADRWCDGRIVATGGGGYAIYSVVPRAWTLVWGALSGEPASDRVPDAWLDRVRRESGEPVPAMLRDPPGAFEPPVDVDETEAINDRTVREVKRRVLPLLTGWDLAF